MKRFITLACLLAIVSCQRTTGTDPAFKTIMIKSNGEVEALPDEAAFHIALYCLENSVKASKNCLVTKSNELIGRLQSLGIKKNDILTTSVNLNKSYTWRNNSNVFEGYRSTTTLIVTIKNIDKLDEVYTELLENRNLELSDLSYTHSKIDSLQNEAYLQALKKSGTLADKLLEKLPEDEKEVLKIGNIEMTSSMPQARGFISDATMEQASAVSNQSIGINTGMVRIAATLYVEYQIR
ncbi:MAG TPA: SIMPL domain-containing protein [Flavobacterium sp.]|jgi:uncharacterized protein YggE